jgi:hypothetical protein
MEWRNAHKVSYAPSDLLVDFVSAFALMRRGWTSRAVDIIRRFTRFQTRWTWILDGGCTGMRRFEEVQRLFLKGPTCQSVEGVGE